MYLIFSDLDNCLLDDSYRFDIVERTIRETLKKGSHLVFNSSKTRAEIISIQSDVGLSLPFIVENGSAIFIPKDYFVEGFDLPMTDGFFYLELGKPYDHIREGIKVIQNELGSVKTFSTLKIGELMEYTGLSTSMAELAKKREYSEPFLKTKKITKKLQSSLEKLELRIIEGNRFYHLLSSTDKGNATRKLIDILKTRGLKFTSVAIGDAYNDIPMLKAVDIPFLTQTGPQGWKIFVSSLMEIDYG